MSLGLILESEKANNKNCPFIDLTTLSIRVASCGCDYASGFLVKRLCVLVLQNVLFLCVLVPISGFLMGYLVLRCPLSATYFGVPVRKSCSGKGCNGRLALTYRR